MNLNDVLVFAEVVEKGSFTAAGDALAMPKSNVSRIVSRLENTLGAKLLERTTRKQALTEAGRIYYQHCLRIREELNSGSRAVEQLKDVPGGRLRVCASVSVGQNLVAGHLSRFMALYPDIQIDFRLTNRRVDLLEENFDVVIRVGALEDSSLIASHLCTQKLYWYASFEYLKTYGKPHENLSDIHKHRCLYMNGADTKSVWFFRKGDVEHRVSFQPAFSCDDFAVLRQLVQDGLGIARLPFYACSQLVEEGSLKRVFTTWEGDSVDIHLLVPSRTGITPKVRVFMDYLKSVVL